MGKKNSFAGMNFMDIMKQQALSSASSPEYCRYCGQDVKQPGKNSTQQDTGSWSNPWEVENNAHVKCHQQHLYSQRRGR